MLHLFSPRPEAAQFQRRVNRFVAEVLVAGQPVLAHVANSGRLNTVLSPGQPCWLRPRPGSQRKTSYDLLAVQTERGPVLIDAHLPNQLVATAWRQGLIPELKGYDAIHAEHRYGSSRIDLALFANNELSCLVEVKSASDNCGTRARWPDAPSSRASRHLRELIDAVGAGHRAAVVFLAQLAWADSILLNRAIDPQFTALAEQAVGCGVALLGYTVCPDLPTGIRWGRSIPVEFA